MVAVHRPLHFAQSTRYAADLGRHLLFLRRLRWFGDATRRCGERVVATPDHRDGLLPPKLRRGRFDGRRSEGIEGYLRHQGSSDRSRADLMQASRSSLATGLSRTQITPAFSACARTYSLENAVMTIVGTRLLDFASWVSSCSPDIPGSLMSVIRHDVCSSRLDCKNSSAEENISALKPSAFRNPAIASQTAPLSSIQEISGSDIKAASSRRDQSYGPNRR